MKFKHVIGIFIIIVLAVTMSGCGKQEAPPPDQQQGQTPPPQTEPPKNVGPPTVVEKDKTPEEHVREYFDAYKAQRYDEAYDLQPAINKAKQTKEEFSQLRSGFPISDYKVLPVRQQGDQEIIDVEYDLGQNGVWITSWLFKKEDSKWIAQEYQVQMKQ